MDSAERIEKLEAQMAMLRKGVNLLAETVAALSRALDVQPPAMATRELSILSPDGGRVCGVIRGTMEGGVELESGDDLERPVVRIETNGGAGRVTIINHAENSQRAYTG